MRLLIWLVKNWNKRKLIPMAVSHGKFAGWYNSKKLNRMCEQGGLIDLGTNSYVIRYPIVIGGYGVCLRGGRFIDSSI